jgi:hypothetical protein
MPTADIAGSMLTLEGLADKLAKAVEIIREAAAYECDGCEAEKPLWHPDGEVGQLWHGYGLDVSLCDSHSMAEAWEAGVIEVRTIKRSDCGHGWYGDACPECHPEPGQ